MGASTKRKKEKQKDFQKAKLKVGKARPKPENFTDTSFKSKSITLNQQSLTLSAPSSASQFTHHLSLLTSRSDTQRRDSLSHLTTALSSRPTNSPPPQPTSVILPPLLPLLLDSASSVRTQLLKLLRALPATDIQDHVAQILPYVRAGMTHLAPDVRLSAIDALSWLLSTAGQDVVACAGGWIKTLNCFLSVLGWHTAESAKWSANRASFGKSGAKGGGVVVRVLTVLAEFLNAGIAPQDTTDSDVDIYSEAGGPWVFPLVQPAANMVAVGTATPYLYLNLFGQPRDEEGEMYETREDRFRVFREKFMPAVERGLEGARQEGGETGRASVGVSKVLKVAVEYSC
ncbi:putative rRNA processing protein Ipi1 [Aspergillus campestris IBT 28561]|uniref:Pre-rRNA-processing protein n=1 Tax=Aspergillus campestris (strain IBT 28561) TaxID=1392248 RepID=A0A2I1CWI3_ASPC2|nr:putative rRNA processing protein Ipi1 [Aspergillus campestris IBT 28561]PKY01972.1 putative rRNA processing protein Ipi1 [Aspergillus campestris IBT 28561]